MVDREYPYLAGERWLDCGSGGGWIEVENRATEKVVGRVLCCGVGDVDRAVLVARRAFFGGPVLTPRRRAEYLRAARSVLARRGDDIPRMVETGESRREVDAVVEALPFYTEEAERVLREANNDEPESSAGSGASPSARTRPSPRGTIRSSCSGGTWAADWPRACTLVMKHACKTPEAGIIGAPYCGRRKSGIGYEHGREGMEGYLPQKHLRVRHGVESRKRDHPAGIG